MNQLPVGGLDAVAPAPRHNLRAAAKLRTRAKILAAAKDLFAERGYEAATIRDIARAAGMSTGAVFASFADKSDLFTEIADGEQVEVAEAMRAAAKGLNGEAAILAMLAAAADRQAAAPALFLAIMSALWTPGLAERVRRRLERRPLSSLVAVAVHEALDADRAPPGVDVAVVTEMIWDGYLSALRRAGLGGITLPAIKTRVAAQVRTILAGARAVSLQSAASARA